LTIAARGMDRRSVLSAGFLSLALCSTGCSVEPAARDENSSYGTTPSLPTASRALIPTVNIAPAIGWPAGLGPRAAVGLQSNAFVRDLQHPRWLYVLPNGDVLVAETNAPPKADGPRSIKAWMMGIFMKRAGAAVPSANRITLLRDTTGSGRADARFVLLQGLNSPFGMALLGDTLYVANTDAIVGYRYQRGATQIDAVGVKLIDLPAGTINHHWTKNIIASDDGKSLFVTVGSNSDVAERGMAVENGRAAIWQVDIATGTHRIFASGLRNANGMAWEPKTRALWTVVNERDELGNDLVPDYLTSVRDGAFYGWPYSYYGQHVDTRVQPQDAAAVARAIAPDYALGAHTAPLGLAASFGTSLPSRFASGMFVGQHGSWNRRPHSGYKVIFIPFLDGRPSGPPQDVLTGFLSEDQKAYGRPVGVALDKRGALLVADDVGNVIWRVSATTGTTASNGIGAIGANGDIAVTGATSAAHTGVAAAAAMNKGARQ